MWYNNGRSVGWTVVCRWDEQATEWKSQPNGQTSARCAIELMHVQAFSCESFTLYNVQYTLQNISASSKWLFSAKLFVVRKWFNKTWTTLNIILDSLGVKLRRCLAKTFKDNITTNQNIYMVDREFYLSTKFAFINWACFDLIWFNSWLTKKISNGNVFNIWPIGSGQKSTAYTPSNTAKNVHI